MHGGLVKWRMKCFAERGYPSTDLYRYVDLPDEQRIVRTRSVGAWRHLRMSSAQPNCSLPDLTVRTKNARCNAEPV